MTTRQLHVKLTSPRSPKRRGNTICTLLVDSIRVSRCVGNGEDLTATVLSKWVQDAYQDRLLLLFADQLRELHENEHAPQYKSGARVIKYMKNPPGYYGVTLNVITHSKSEFVYLVELDGSYGTDCIINLCQQIGVIIEWNPVSEKYSNDIFYTALIKYKTPSNVYV